MSASLHSSENAEPNLTPMLDMVFQLVTFFMLVINFQAASLDMSLKLPVIGSARPADKGAEELLVLNVNKNGKVMMYGNEQDPAAFVKNEGKEARFKLELSGKKVKKGEELPTLVVVRADLGTPFELLNKVLTECQNEGFRKFALRAMSKAEGS
ncbi:MAG: biopolymer transporter ExbD [Planctomycetia bacterium]|nr:biopolymer transporter ExbD [Planctomycetia bacterium]